MTEEELRKAVSTALALGGMRAVDRLAYDLKRDVECPRCAGDGRESSGRPARPGRCLGCAGRGKILWAAVEKAIEARTLGGKRT